MVLSKASDVAQLPGFDRVKPQVYAGLFPVNSDDFEPFREALEKLVLNDASLFYEPESSDALGFGFRCGFLGMLHMEIVQERLEREYDLDLITSAPSFFISRALVSLTFSLIKILHLAPTFFAPQDTDFP